MPVPDFHPHEEWQWQRQADDTATLVCLHGGNSLRRHFKLSYRTIFTGLGAADFLMQSRHGLHPTSLVAPTQTAPLGKSAN